MQKQDEQKLNEPRQHEPRQHEPRQHGQPQPSAESTKKAPAEKVVRLPQKSSRRLRRGPIIVVMVVIAISISLAMTIALMPQKVSLSSKEDEATP